MSQLTVLYTTILNILENHSQSYLMVAMQATYYEHPTSLQEKSISQESQSSQVLKKLYNCLQQT